MEEKKKDLAAFLGALVGSVLAMLAVPIITDMRNRRVSGRVLETEYPSRMAPPPVAPPPPRKLSKYELLSQLLELQMDEERQTRLREKLNALDARLERGKGEKEEEEE